MKRKMIGAAISYLSGLFFASFFFDGLKSMLILIPVSLAVYIVGRTKGLKIVDFIIITLFFFSAVTVSSLYTSLCYEKIISYSGDEVSFSGSITEYKVYNKNASYVLVGKINGCQRAKVRIYTDNLNAGYGDNIYIEKCIFYKPQSDYLFDSEMYNKARHIYLETSSPDGVTVRNGRMGKIRNVIGQFRESMTNALIESAGDETGGFLSGMIFGEKQYIDSNTKTSLYRIGIGHILAVSGLHVSIIAAAFLSIIRKLKINKYNRFLYVNILLLLLIIMTNYTVSAIRASLMFDIAYVAELFGEQNDSFNSLSIAVLIICLTDCYAVINSGFILSISGTLGIAVFAPFMTKGMNKETVFGKLKVMLASSLCTSLAVMPASMFFFDETSLIAPVANVLLVPLCIVSMMFGLIFVLTGGMFDFLLFPAKLLISLVLTVSDISSYIGIFHIPRMSSIMPVLFLVSGVLIVTFCIFSKDRRLILSFISVLIVANTIISSAIYYKRTKKPIVAVLGRDGNMAVVVSVGGKSIIADMSDNMYVGEYVEKYLSQNGYDRVEALILNGNAQSHYEDYKSELKYFEPEKVYTYMCSIEDSVQYYSINIESIDYIIEINEGKMSITSDETEILIDYTGDGDEKSGEFTIYRGDRCVFFQDMINFEIIIDDNIKQNINKL